MDALCIHNNQINIQCIAPFVGVLFFLSSSFFLLCVHPLENKKIKNNPNSFILCGDAISISISILIPIWYWLLLLLLFFPVFLRRRDDNLFFLSITNHHRKALTQCEHPLHLHFHVYIFPFIQFHIHKCRDLQSPSSSLSVRCIVICVWYFKNYIGNTDQAMMYLMMPEITWYVRKW